MTGCTRVVGALTLLLTVRSSQADEVGCDLSGDYGSKSWRVLASTTRSGWAWDVEQLKFVTVDGKTLGFGSDGCSPIHSGSVSDLKHGGISGYEPVNAFTKNRAWWCGRKDAGQFYLGLKCTKTQMLRGLYILQHRNSKVEREHVADHIKVQRLDGHVWKTVHSTRLTANPMKMRLSSGCKMEEGSITNQEEVPGSTMAPGLVANSEDAAQASWTVHGTIKLTVSSLEGPATIRIAAMLQTKKHQIQDFLTATISNLYGLSAVEILDVDYARRLGAAAASRIQIKFQGSGTVTPNVAPSAFQQSVQKKFKDNGFEIHSVSIELSMPPDTKVQTEATKVQPADTKVPGDQVFLQYILAPTLFVVVMIALAVILKCRRQAAAIGVSSHDAVVVDDVIAACAMKPVGVIEEIEPNPVILADNFAKEGNAADEEMSTASTKSPLSEPTECEPDLF